VMDGAIVSMWLMHLLGNGLDTHFYSVEQIILN